MPGVTAARLRFGAVLRGAAMVGVLVGAAVLPAPALADATPAQRFGHDGVRVSDGAGQALELDVGGVAIDHLLEAAGGFVQGDGRWGDGHGISFQKVWGRTGTAERRERQGYAEGAEGILEISFLRLLRNLCALCVRLFPCQAPGFKPPYSQGDRSARG